jgi:hypothetical protein
VLDLGSLLALQISICKWKFFQGRAELLDSRLYWIGRTLLSWNLLWNSTPLFSATSWATRLVEAFDWSLGLTEEKEFRTLPSSQNTSHGPTIHKQASVATRKADKEVA